MKNILYLFIILSFSNCNNAKKPTLKTEKTVAPKNKAVATNLKIDKEIKMSEPKTKWQIPEIMKQAI